MAEKLTPIIEPDDTMKCVRCSATLGKCIDGTYLLFGGARLYPHDKVPVKFFCDQCGKVFKVYEHPPPNTRLGDAQITTDILNALGRDYNPDYLRDKNKKHVREKEQERDHD
jgi:hypothetical protein